MKKTTIYTVFLIIATTLVSCNKTTKEKANLISAEAAQTLLQNENIQLIDIRTPKEFNEARIENAQNIDFLSSTFADNIKKLNKEKPILIYCRSGRRSAKSIKKLLEAGFTEIYDLEGGIIKWKQKGFKTQ